MRAVLKVVGGKNDGRQIKISVPEFVIGRGEKAHLKPSSELISRMHCAVRVKDGKVEVEDLGSRNGSFVNDEQLTGPYQAKSGDRLRVGNLNFEILIDPTQSGNKKPRVKDVADVAARTVEIKKSSKDGAELEDSISDWLAEPDDTPIGQSTTVQFSMDDLESILDYSARKKESIEELRKSDEGDSVGSTGSVDSVEDDETDEDGKKKKKKKKEAGKLPPLPKFSHDDSTSAAGDVLKKFFNRR